MRRAMYPEDPWPLDDGFRIWTALWLDAFHNDRETWNRMAADRYGCSVADIERVTPPNVLLSA